MGALERTIARAGRRAALDLALLGAGRGIAIGVCGGLVLLGLDRMTGLTVPVAAYPILVGVVAAVALAVTLARRPGALDVAVRLDRSLGLKDRLGTGVAIRDGRARGELTELADLDAQRVAATVNVRAAAPVRVTRIWPVALVLAVLLAAGVAFLPAFGDTGSDDDRPAVTRAELEQQRTRIVETIDRTLGDIDDQTLDSASQKELDTLDQLARQLEKPPADEVELARLRDQSAAQMEVAADRMAEDARRNLEAVDEVTRRFAEAEPASPPSREPPAGLDAFMDAVRRGDLDEAAERFDDVVQRRDELAPPQREQLADDMRALAEHLEPDRETDASKSPDAAELERLREALKDMGVDEQTMRDMLDEPDPRQRDETLDKALRDAQDKRDKPDMPDMADKDAGKPPAGEAERKPGERGADQETRRRIAEDLAAAREKQQVREQADGQRQRLSEAMKKAADEVEGKQQQTQQQQKQQQQQQQAPTQEQQRPGQQQQPTQQQRPGQQPQPMPQPDGRTPSVSELLRQMQQTRQTAEGRKADSERLREAARKLADTMTDEQKQQLMEQWMRQTQDASADRPETPPSTGDGRTPAGQNAGGAMRPGTSPAPPKYEDLDLRDKPDADDQKIIGEWLSDTPVGDTPAPASAAGRAAVGRARSAAEQAIEKSVVPSRYHEFIRRYFGRLQETADTPPPAQSDTGGGTP